MLRNNKDENVTHPEQKLELIASYYSKVYSSHPPEEEVHSFLNALNFMIPTDDPLDALNSPITLLEVENAIASLN